MSTILPMRFLVARNPDPASSLRFLIQLPIAGGLVLKARDTWPRTSRVYCHRAAEGWPQEPEIVEDVGVLERRRRGPAIDLLLDRPGEDRAQFGFPGAAVERKSVSDLAGSLSNGSLSFELAKLAALGRAAVVVEEGYGKLVAHAQAHVPSGFLPEPLARVQGRS